MNSAFTQNVVILQIVTILQLLSSVDETLKFHWNGGLLGNCGLEMFDRISRLHEIHERLCVALKNS